MIKIPCHCGNIIETGLNEIINLETLPDIYSDIIEGNFMTFTCPECGSILKTETGVRLKDAKNSIDIEFIPETDRGSYLSGRITTSAARVAIGYKELVEKIVISGAKLDDRVIEIIKFNMLEKARNNSIRIFLNHTEDSELVFHIYGLKPDQVGISRVPFSVYENISAQLDKLLSDDDIKLFTDSAYVSVSRIYLED